MPDVVTDQTSAHDALNGYVPNGLSLAEAGAAARAPTRTTTSRGAMAAMADHVRAMLELQRARRGRRSITATTSARRRQKAGVANAFDIPGFVPEYIRPLFCEGQGAVPLGGALRRSGRHRRHRRARARDVRATTRRCAAGFALARERVAFQGLPARIFWLGYGERARFGLAINDLVRRGAVKAPIVIGRDHLDTGSVASPNRETEGMRDGSDAIADWPVLNALLNTSCGATWVSVHHGGGVGIGYSLHAGMVIVADGTREADEKLAARADLRSRASASSATPTRAIPKRSPTARRAAALTCRCFRRTAEDRPMMIPDVPRSSAACSPRSTARPAAWPAHSGRPRRLRHRPDLAAAAAARSASAATSAQYIDVERIATTPERFLQALARASPFPAPSRTSTRRRRAGARAAFDAALAFLDSARAPGVAPATFLLDEFLELRTFESFPGLRSVLRDCVAALASSGNRFVLTTRYAARAHRLLRDAPAQFEIIHVAPLTAAEVRATLPGGIAARHRRARTEDARRARARRARAGSSRRCRRPSGLRARHRRSGDRAGVARHADPISALAALLAPGGAALAQRCRFATSSACIARAATARSRPSSRSSQRKSR